MNRLAHFGKTLPRVFLMLIAFLPAGNAQAEWFQLGRSDNFRVYLDQRLIQKKGDSAQVWQLVDFTTAQWANAQTVVGSIKNLIEYDCAQPRLRSLAGEAYSEQMGEGRMVANEQFREPQWEGVEPGSTAEQVRNIACRKK